MTGSSTHPGATLERLDNEAIQDLLEELRGDLVTPDDEPYDDARRVWNGLVNTYPVLIARCAGTVDVMTAIDFAREHDVRLSVKSGGHHETGTAVVQSRLVVDLSGMDSVQVDPTERTVRVEPGVRAGDLHHETQQVQSGGSDWQRRGHRDRWVDAEWRDRLAPPQARPGN